MLTRGYLNWWMTTGVKSGAVLVYMLSVSPYTLGLPAKLSLKGNHKVIKHISRHISTQELPVYRHNSELLEMVG